MNRIESTTSAATDSRCQFGIWVGAFVIGGLMLVPLSTAWSLAPDLGHGWAAAILIAYLWWERWDQRPPLRQARPGWVAWLFIGVVAVLIVPLRLLLTPYPLWPAALLGYLGVLVGLLLYSAALLAGRPGLRWVAAPLIILLGVVPWPGAVDRMLILPLREGVAAAVAEISNLLGHPALAAGTSVQLAGGWVGIDEACGGIRSLQASVMTALFFGVWLRLNWGRRLALLVVAGLAAVAGNFLRVLFLSWLVTGPGNRLHAWHDPAGWMALAFSLGLTGWVGWTWRSVEREVKIASAVSTVKNCVRPTRSLVVWFGLALVLLIGTETGTRLWYAHGAARIEATVPQWTVALPTAIPSYRQLPLTEPAREMLRPDRFASGAWVGPDQRAWNAYYIEWAHGQVARSVPFLHNPTVCLPYAGCELVRELGVIQVRWSGGVIPFHCYVFSRMDEEIIVAFTIWDPSRGRILQASDQGWSSWWEVQWRDVREARQHQPAQLLTLAAMGGGDREAVARKLATLITSARGISSQ